MKYLLFLFAGLWALPASAHVKWFIENIEPQSIKAFSLTEPAVLVWIAVVLCFLIAGYALEQYTGLPTPAIRWMQWSAKSRPHIVRASIALFGVWLVLNTLTGASIDPTHHHPAIMVLQTLAGIALILSACFSIEALRALAAILLAMLWFASVALFGLSVIDAGYMLGFALLVYSPHTARSLRILSIAIGASLAATAFNEKLLAPELSQTFLSAHSWNFMANIGLPYSDRLFILSAGMMEVVFGTLLMTGWITRLTILGLAPILIITVCILGPSELLGHMPIFIIAILLLLYGNTKKRS